MLGRLDYHRRVQSSQARQSKGCRRHDWGCCQYIEIMDFGVDAPASRHHSLLCELDSAVERIAT